MAISPTVSAAGGVVWRGQHGDIEVALVHRPRYDDWTLPKGKVMDGESELEAAVREVGEEMGASVAVSRRVGRVQYSDNGAKKTVAYWAMRFLGGEFVANDEVDAVEWLTPAHAATRLTYAVDLPILTDFDALPVPDSVILLVRHAKAGKRSEWRRNDRLRPLDPAGAQQAQELVEFLRRFGPQRVISAGVTRCVQTVEPLAASLGLAVHVEPAFDDDSYVDTPTATETALLSLAKPGWVTVVCSQGTAIPALIDTLAPGTDSSETRKGSTWALSFVDGDIIAVDYYGAARGRHA
ncbi:MAG: NUDIX hydrolase [Pseudonocardiales bacterium]|nr:NUDIX domain-containing protein [Actinomycetota bacterium]